MSFMVDNTLLPRAPYAAKEYSNWVGSRAERRETWVEKLHEVNAPQRVWSGEFDVERRPSWVSRTSGRGFSDFDSKELEKEDSRDQLYLVSWEEDDSENPLNFSTGKKWGNAMVLAFAVFMVSIASSGFSQGTPSRSQGFAARLGLTMCCRNRRHEG